LGASTCRLHDELHPRRHGLDRCGSPDRQRNRCGRGPALLRENVEDLPITGVIIIHSHADHFCGEKKVFTPEDIAERDVPVIAPERFFKEGVSENLLADNTMGRRASDI
jgi:glyoxylase-like metal-dependent hydrolase (beta-lactamase superfamily II)